jgi:hypothetical protein
MKYVLGYGLSNTIGIPAGVDQRVVKANYNWYWYTGLTEIQRLYILEALILSQDGTTSFDTIASRFATLYIPRRIPGYKWNIAVIKSYDSLLGRYSLNSLRGLISLDGILYNIAAANATTCI